MAAEVAVNGGSSTLSSGINNVVTTIPIQAADIARFPNVASTQYHIAITDGTNTELCTVTGGFGTASLTVTRASESYNGVQTAFAFIAGSAVTHVLTIQAFQGLSAGGLTSPLATDVISATPGGVLTGFAVQGVASAANYLQVTSAVAASAPSLSAQGSDANISLTLIPKGTGSVVVSGPTTLSGDLTVTGNVGINSAPAPTTSFAVTSAALTGANQTGGVFSVTATAAGTGNVRGLQVLVTSAPGATTNALFGVVVTLALGAGGTVTGARGISVAAITASTTSNYGIEVGVPSGGATANVGVHLLGGAPALLVDAGGITVTGASTITGTLSGITTLTATTLAGTLSTAAQANITSVGTLSSLTVTGVITANGGLALSGVLGFTAAASQLVPGATSFSHRNNANTADNLLITDAGAITVRNTISGVTTLTATTLAGTLSTAAQPNVTSVGILIGLALSGSFIPSVDNTVDIGSTSFRIHSIFVSSTITSGNGGFVLNGGAALNRALRLQTTGNDRWQLLVNNTAESGSSVGSDLEIRRYDDAGTFQGTSLSIIRSTGVTTVFGALVANTGLTLTGTLTMATAVSILVPGATSFSHRNNANSADNLLITDAGAITVRSTISGVTTLTATTLAGTLSTAAQPNVTSVGTLTAVTVSGLLTMTAAVSQLVPGATSFSLRNTANNADNLIVTDAGAITVRGAISGITTLTATTLAGTLSTAAQPNITSTGALTVPSLTTTTGGITCNHILTFPSATPIYWVDSTSAIQSASHITYFDDRGWNWRETNGGSTVMSLSVAGALSMASLTVTTALALPAGSVTTTMLAANSVNALLTQVGLGVAWTSTTVNTWLNAWTTGSVTCSGAMVRIEASLSIAHTVAGALVLVGLGVDGSIYTGLMEVNIPGANMFASVTYVYYYTPTAGSHTFQVFLYNAVAGTMTLPASYNVFAVCEMRR